MTDKLEDINAQCRAETAAGAYTGEQVRAFIHVPTWYRTPDELAEYAAVRAEAREQLPETD